MKISTCKSASSNAGAKMKKLEFILKIHSSHPSLPAPVAAGKVVDSASELYNHLRKEYEVTRVEIERRKTFPVDPITILVTIAVFVGVRVAEKTVDELYDATLHWAKAKLKGARVSKANKPSTGAKKMLKHPKH